MTSPSRHLAGNHQPEQNHHDHTDRDESALHARRQQGDQGMHHMIGRGLVVGMDSVAWGALELELTDGHVSDRLTLALNKEHQRRMEHPLHGCRVQLETARRDLDRDAVIAADQGDRFAAGSAVAVEGCVHEFNVSGSLNHVTTTMRPIPWGSVVQEVA